MAEFEKAKLNEKIASYLIAGKKVIIAVVVAIVVLLAGIFTYTGVSASAAKNGLAAIDKISYELTKDSADLSEEDLNARKAACLEKLAAYVTKGGITGVRANMLAAEITYSQKNYADAAKYYTAAAEKNKKAYTSGLESFNAAVCFENVNDLDNAVKYYSASINDKEFMLKDHAYFSLGRVLEAKGDKEGAVKAYNDLRAASPDSTWANLAKTRLIVLDAE